MVKGPDDSYFSTRIALIKSQLGSLNLTIMVDPVAKPLKWSKSFQIYVEKHNMYDVFQELLKKIIIYKPEDPLAMIRDEIQRIARGLHNPRTFIVGPNVAKYVGQRLANASGAKFITLEDIIQSPLAKGQLNVFTNGEDKGNDQSRKLLVSILNERLSANDCETGGYVLYGFPQNKTQTIFAQQAGLLPRQVFVFLPDTEEEEEEESHGSEESPMTRGTSSQSSMTRVRLQAEFTSLKDIGSQYHFEICKVISFEKLKRTSSTDLESELLALLLTSKPSGAPFVPRIVVIGPPSSGKTSIAEYLAEKFGVVNVDWVELIRGAARWNDSIAKEAEEFLKNLNPLKDESVKAILTRRLTKDDCEKKGWVLQGFPGNLTQCKMLEDLCLGPNRIFMLSCNQDLCIARTAKKKKAVMQRHLEGTGDAGPVNEKQNFLLFPFGDISVTKRYDRFVQSLEEIVPFYGAKIIHVDASMKPSDVKNFVESSIHRPPIPRRL